jgi:antitoxin ParD1/3/4
LKDILGFGLNNIWSPGMATMNISLPDSLREWVESKSQQGSYANKSDYVRDLIRKDQLQSLKLKAMQDAISTGLESGEPRAFDKSAFKKRMKSSL